MQAFSRGKNKAKSFQAVREEKEHPFVILNPVFHQDKLLSESLDFKGIKGCKIQKQVRNYNSWTTCFIMTLKISLPCIPYQHLRYSTCLIKTVATQDYFSTDHLISREGHFFPGLSYRFLAYAGVSFFNRCPIFQQ